MINLGLKSEMFSAYLLERLEILGCPTSLPFLAKDENVVCGFDQGLGELMIACESLADMKELYDKYLHGGATRIHWYRAPDVGFINSIAPEGKT